MPATKRKGGGLLLALMGCLFTAALPGSAAVLVWSALLGGVETDGAAAMAEDGRGGLYVAGRSDSTELPGARGVGRDALIARLDARSGAIDWLLRLGGEGSDEAIAIAATGSGELFVVGATDSRRFPDGPRSGPCGGRDLFAARLSPDGSEVLWAVRVGGSGFETACKPMLVDERGDLIIAGYTASPDFPATPGAGDDRYCGGAMDAFVMKLAGADGRQLWCRFLGGAGADIALALAPGGGGDLLVGGATQSADFPASPGACDRKLSGGVDAFVAKLAGDGRLLWATFLGGEEDGAEETRALALGRGGAALVAGYTAAADFPVSRRSLGGPYSGGGDMFVAELSGERGALVWSGLLGGCGADDAHALAVDGLGRLIVAGGSCSPDFPTTPGAWSRSHGGGESDVVLALLSPDGGRLLWGSYLGGDGEETAFAAQAGGAGRIHLAGDVLGGGFPGARPSASGGERGDGWVCAISPETEASR